LQGFPTNSFISLLSNVPFGGGPYACQKTLFASIISIYNWERWLVRRVLQLLKNHLHLSFIKGIANILGVTDLINGLVDLLSLETRAVWDA